jgi:hypothetical protein
MSSMMLHEAPGNELVKEVYARFGLAYYHSECLHKTLCHIYVMASFQDIKDVTRPRVEEKLAYAYSLTLGQIRDEVKELIPEKLLSHLDEGIERRNFLAHHFWFERVHLMFSTNGLNLILQELDEYSSLFQRLDEIASEHLETHTTKKFGLTDEILQDCLDEVISGKPMEPLPQKRKPKKQECIVRVWEFNLEDVGKPLVFETDDGELWQLCDVGLGWTYYDEVKPHWQENKIIAQYLPANIDPRPKDSEPWHYEFNLAKGAVFWVRPGKRERSFKWGIQTKRRNTDQGPYS